MDGISSPVSARASPKRSVSPGRQKPLALALLVELDVPAGIGPVRLQAPDFGKRAHPGENAERLVRLVGLVENVGMLFGDAR